MTAISQKYNTYLQGMSDQPDEIMKPGQLKDSLNTFPDVTFGLLKRPSLGFIDGLTRIDTDGSWSSYYRVTSSGTREEYIIHITQAGNFRIWDSKGDSMQVNIGGTIDPTTGAVSGGNSGYSATLPYAVHDEKRQIQFNTILDTTIINNRKVRPKMTSKTAPANHCSGNYYAFVSISTLAYGQSYTLELDQTENKTSSDTPAHKVTFDTPTTGQTATSVEKILTEGDGTQDGLVTQLLAVTNGDMLMDPPASFPSNDQFFTIVKAIGSGIYLESDHQFTVTTPENQLFDIAAVAVDEAASDCSSSPDPACIGHGQKRYAAVQNVGQLPIECRHNMVLKIANSLLDEDDYYVRFQGNQDQDGEGVWEETVEPGSYVEFDGDTMPHRIVRVSPILFVVQPIPWEERVVGDEKTNPLPSFINKKDPDSNTLTPPIQRVFFYRNRLVLLAGENVFMSRPGDYFNLFSLSALNVSVSDPIDTAATSQYSSLLLDAIVVNSGLVLFSEFQQFLLTTDSDLLSPQTVKISNLASYDFNPHTSPFSMGNTIGFFSTAGVNSRLYEMSQIFREGEPDVMEQSKILNRRLPQDLTEIADSKENGLIMAAQRDGSDIFCYRYFNQGTERLQSAWFRWDIIGELEYHTIMGDKYFAVIESTDTQNDTIYNLVSMDLSKRYTTSDVSGEQFDYRIHMDYEKEVVNAKLTYLDPKVSTDPNAGYTTFPLEGVDYYPRIKDKTFYAYSLDNGLDYAPVEPILISGLDHGRVPGDWTLNNGSLHLGYNYEMEVDFPRMFLNSDNVRGGVTDTTASLTIHRCKLSMGPQGVYSTVLKRKGMDDYTIDYSSLDLDAAALGQVPLAAHQVNTVNVYTNNYNFNLSLQSEHPGPCTLYSMAWEGMYSSLNYRRS